MRTKKTTGLLALGSYILPIAIIGTLSSCSHSGGGFQTDSSTGLVYRLIKHDENGVKAADSDFAKVILSYSVKGKDGKDSILFNTHDPRNIGRLSDSTGTMYQPLALKKTFNGCLEQGLLMMAQGDSAEFQINADSLYIKTFHFPPDKLPPGVTPTTIYTFHVKLMKFVTRKELAQENEIQRQKYMERMLARKAIEPQTIADYLKANHYDNVKPDKDSIFVLTREKGNGAQIKDGDSVQVSYAGTLLNGQPFDPPAGSGRERSSFTMFYNSAKPTVIMGWIKVLGTMHKGEKVKVLLPSAMAYGSRGNGQVIPPYSPLIFDINILNVKSGK